MTSTQQTTTPPELYTAEEVAKILKCTRRQLTERIMKRPGFPKRLNPQIMGSLKLWKKQDIHAWIENGGR